MDVDDIGVGMRLKSEAGWNQTEADWHRFLNLQPDGCFVAELDGDPCGTVTTCRFGDVAWIAMMLVDAQLRGQGIGTGLMSHAISYLESSDITSIRLDATQLGLPVYEKLGFLAQFEIVRYAGEPIVGEKPARVSALTHNDLHAACELDREVTGTRREKLLSALLTESPDNAWQIRSGDRADAFVLGRQGSNAIQIGPCLAESPIAGRDILTFALARLEGAGDVC